MVDQEHVSDEAPLRHDDPFEVVLLDRLARLERMLENVAAMCCPYCRDEVLERLHPDETHPKSNGKVRH